MLTGCLSFIVTSLVSDFKLKSIELSNSDVAIPATVVKNLFHIFLLSLELVIMRCCNHVSVYPFTIMPNKQAVKHSLSQRRYPGFSLCR